MLLVVLMARMRSRTVPSFRLPAIHLEHVYETGPREGITGRRDRPASIPSLSEALPHFIRHKTVYVRFLVLFPALFACTILSECIDSSICVPVPVPSIRLLQYIRDTASVAGWRSAASIPVTNGSEQRKQATRPSVGSIQLKETKPNPQSRPAAPLLYRM